MLDDLTVEAVRTHRDPGADAPVRAVTESGTSLVEGSSFCVSSSTGDIEPFRQHGLFVRDTRMISTWRLLVDNAPLEQLAMIPAEPYECTFLTRAVARPGHDDTTVVVERRRLIGSGMRDDVTIRNFGTETAGLQVVLEVDTDFADLFEVKEGRDPHHARIRHHANGNELVFMLDHAGGSRGVRIRAPGAHASSRTLAFTVAVPAQQEWSTTLEVLPIIDEDELEAAFPTDQPVAETVAARRMQLWRDRAPVVDVGYRRLQQALDHSERDLGALRIVDREHPEDEVVAAGAPWFMALFGRDSLLTSWMSIAMSPQVALGTLRTLARLQGRRNDLMTEEAPGRILHEVRVGMDTTLALGGGHVYYGSIDSTPLFVMLVDEALRWGAPLQEVESLLPAVDAALDWLRSPAVSGRTGFVEYQRSTDRGLLHQGWKDSHDAISFADGTPARTPIALAEVQGYTYGAFRARAHLADVLGDGQAAAEWAARAADLRDRFDTAFWIPDEARYAIALDRDARQVDALASNMGQCLWTGIVREDRARQVAAALLDPDLFTGFGVRTLARSMRAFNPVSYHNGSVWPHDTALIAAGLARYGFVEEAATVATALLDTACAFGGRLPELFCGFDRTTTACPVPYPAACTPQAWASAAPFQLLRTALQLEPCIPHGVVRARPVPGFVGHVHLGGIDIAGSTVTIDADTDKVEIDGLPDGVRFVESLDEPACAWHPHASTGRGGTPDPA